MTRLPVVDADNDGWGTVLNDFLGVSHNTDGTLKSDATVAVVLYNTGHTAAQRRDAIQAALDLATVGGTVRLQAGKTWDITNSGSTVTAQVISGTTSISYCLKIPSGVKLDLNGGTIKRNAGAGDCAIVINAHPTIGGGDVNISIVNGTFDGNNIDTSTSAGVWLFGLTGGYFDNLEITNMKRIGFFLAGSTDVVLGTLTAHSNAANPFALGVNVVNQKLTTCHLGTLKVRSTSVYAGNPTNFPGNPIALVGIDCSFDVWDASGATAGIKVYGTDGLQGSAVFCGAQTGTDTNSGLKLQGDVSDPVKNVQIGMVRSRGQNGSGLWMEYTEDCAVDIYDGIGNCLQASQNDVWLGGLRDRLGSVRVTGSAGVGVMFRNYGNEVSIDRVVVQNPTGNGVQATMASGQRCRIGELYVTDDRGGSALMIRGLQVDGTGGAIEIGRRYITGHTGTAMTVSTGGARITSPGGQPNTPVTTWIFAHRGSNTTGATTNDQLRITPGRIERRTRVIGMAIEITVVGESGSTFTPVIYADNGVGRVGSLIVAGSALNTNAATGWVQTSAIDVTLDPGLYHFGGVQNGAPTTPATLRILTGGSTAMQDIPASMTSTLPGTNPGNGSYTKASVTGAPPAEFASTAVSGTGAARVILLTAEA